MSDTQRWIDTVRSSHDRLAGLVTPLAADEVTAPSYASEWTIAQVASHLGSQAEIFELFLAAGLSGEPTPGGEAFGPIWDRWNAKAPELQVADSVEADGRLVETLEQMPQEQRDAFALSMFGMDLDVAGFASMRLGEHAVHTWDIAVALDPSALIAADAVELIVDLLPLRVGRAGKPVEGAEPVTVRLTDPERAYVLTLSPEITLTPTDTVGEDALNMPAEAFIRLVFGRLDADHTPDSVADSRLGLLRSAFPGF